METTDLFGMSEGIQLGSKWSIQDFVNVGSKYRRSGYSAIDPNMDTNLKMELERAIKEADLRYSKLTVDYDKMFRDLTSKRRELKTLMEEVKAFAKPQDIAMLWNSEISLIGHQIRVIEDKQKLEGERFKNVREEKKLAKEKNPEPIAAAGGNVIIGGPLQVAQNAANVTTDNRSVGANEIGVVPLVTNAERVPLAMNPTTNYVGTTAEQPVMVPPSSPIAVNTAFKAETPVYQDITGSVVTTAADLTSRDAEDIQRILDNKEQYLKMTTSLGTNYASSLAAMENRRKDLKEVMYVNITDGSFYTRAFEMNNATGQYDTEVLNYQYKSVKHINKVKFNPMTHECSMLYYPEDNIMFELVSDDAAMPEFYKKEWADSKTDLYRLPPDDLIKISESYK